MMDDIDRKICGILQGNGRASSAELAQAVGLSVSAANERVRRLATTGVITGWEARLDPLAFGLGLSAFVLVDMAYDGEEDAVTALTARPEVQELHHVSGAHSYVMKLRVADTRGLQDFLAQVVKPLPAVLRTESIIVLDTAKETAAIAVPGAV